LDFLSFIAKSVEIVKRLDKEKERIWRVGSGGKGLRLIEPEA
jgi:hypothetical protein